MTKKSQKVGRKRQQRAVEARKKVLKRREGIRAKAKEEREEAKKERDSQREYNKHFVTVRYGSTNDGRQEMLEKIQHNAKVLEAIEAAEKKGGLADKEPEDTPEEGGMIGGCADVVFTPNPEPEAAKAGE